jgi:transcriptional regulator with XRE-family HTH domain
MYGRYCKLRDLKGLKDSDIAKITGITQSTFSDWKKGKSAPNAKKLVAIAKVLETTVEYLVLGEEAIGTEDALVTKMKSNHVFWNNAKMLFFLPPYAQEQIFDYIEMVSDKVEKEKRRVSAS